MPSPISGQSPWRRYRRVVTVPQPAAGADWSLIVPAGSVYELVSVYGSLTTSAVVADRGARLQLGDGHATYLDLAPQAVQAASLTNRYAWAAGMSTFSADSGQVMGLPRLYLEPGWTLGSATDGIDVADQWSTVYALVLETVVRGGPVDLAMVPELYVEVLAAPGS
jgi:hypothetical protein